MRAEVGVGLPIRIGRAESAGNLPNRFICRKVCMVMVRSTVSNWYMRDEVGAGLPIRIGRAESAGNLPNRFIRSVG
jgi:hypothetical protein